MRGLAEFVMSGRRQAILVVLGLGLLPWVYLLNPILIALILMRKGWQEAAAIGVWALLPALVWASVGRDESLLMLLAVSGLALSLREGGSWQLTLLAAIIVGAASEALLRIRPQELLAMYEFLANNAEAQEMEFLSREAFLDVMPSRLGPGYMLMAIGMLIMARWQQAVLYNPGGFQQEFHSLRLSQNVVLGLVGMMLLITAAGDALRAEWTMYLAVPIVISGIALAHAIVAKLQASRWWLSAFYMTLLWSVQLVLILALIDSWYDFRSRIKPGE